jgi:hypothetical protein
VIALGLLAVGVWLERARRGGTVLVTFALMLVIGSVFMHGYRNTGSGRSDMRALAERIWQTYPDAELYYHAPRGQRASVDLSIYANRTTGWITQEELLQPAPTSRSQVVLVRQREYEPVPIPLPGWEELMVLPRDDGGAWRAWARPASR